MHQRKPIILQTNTDGEIICKTQTSTNEPCMDQNFHSIRRGAGFGYWGGGARGPGSGLGWTVSREVAKGLPFWFGREWVLRLRLGFGVARRLRLGGPVLGKGFDLLFDWAQIRTPTTPIGSGFCRRRQKRSPPTWHDFGGPSGRGMAVGGAVG